MRLNNYISSSGLCSRRQADKLIEAGRVSLNGRPAKLGMRVEEGDRVQVDGRQIVPRKKEVYLALNKPVGITSTTERHIRGNIIDFVNYPQRIFPIGRLDKDSQGLILLTSDGSVVNKILREENNHKKEYLVRVDRDFDQDFLDCLSQGVRIYNPVKKKHVLTKKCPVIRQGRRSFKIILSQGLNRQIRRMVSQCGYQVVRLERTKIMNISLGDLAEGQWRHLTDQEMELIRKL